MLNTIEAGSPSRGFRARVMAQVAENPRLISTISWIATAFFTIIVAMLGWWINSQANALNDTLKIANSNGNRLTAIETRLQGMERDIRDIKRNSQDDN